MTWLPWPVLAKKRWPAVEFQEKRGITLAEHLAIVAREQNPERKAFCKLAWHLGASQSDLAFLEAENVDWDNHVISYKRMKTDTVWLGILVSLRSALAFLHHPAKTKEGGEQPQPTKRDISRSRNKPGMSNRHETSESAKAGICDGGGLKDIFSESGSGQTLNLSLTFGVPNA